MPTHPLPQLLRLVAATAVLALAAAATLTAAQQAATRAEQSLPRFEGTLLGGGRAGTELFRGKRGLLFVFASQDEHADRMAGIITALMPEAQAANVQLLGINRDPNAAEGRRFATLHGLEFPILRDADGLISRKLQARPGVPIVLVIDAEGYIIYGWAGMEGDAEQVADFRDRELRRVLYLEQEQDAVAPSLGLAPEAPPFEVRSLTGETVTLEQLSGNVVVFMFFLPTCPHCHDALKFLDKLAAQLAHSDLRIVPVSMSNRRYVIEDMQEELDIQLALYTDPTGKVRRDYAYRMSVPDTLVIDRQGRVVVRRTGVDARIQALLTMQIRNELGVPNPILLERAGYSGDEFCGVCHAAQRATWSLTTHARAFQTLIEHGADRNAECLPCHTVGWDEPGGFSAEHRYPYLEGVQCENCHGRGGPHQSPEFAARGFESTCAGCHTSEHSLHFVFAERLPMISHAANLQFSALSLQERRKLLEERDVRARKLFEAAPYAGSAACQGCHAKEHALWAESPHARAMQTLEARGKGSNSDCQQCHVTGFGEDTGWPQGGDSLREVGCESCHGPGGRHIEQAGQGAILRLTEKCESCVILQICGSCHDQDNDPGFEFELEDKLDRIRHGFREPRVASR